jgi:hypothetical protein
MDFGSVDFGSVIAFGAICILVIPVVLLFVDLTGTSSKEVIHEDNTLISYSVSNKEEGTAKKEEVAETLPSEESNNIAVGAVDFQTNGWRCACEGGFLPPGLLQNFSGAEAVLRMSAGRCYHKKNI